MNDCNCFLPKSTALILLVEALYVDYLSEEPNPPATADEIIKSLFDVEEAARKAVGHDSFYQVQISEVVSSFARPRRKKSRNSEVEARPRLINRLLISSCIWA